MKVVDFSVDQGIFWGNIIFVLHSHRWLKVGSNKNRNKSLINFDFKNSAYFHTAYSELRYPQELFKNEAIKCYQFDMPQFLHVEMNKSLKTRFLFFKKFYLYFFHMKFNFKWFN